MVAAVLAMFFAAAEPVAGVTLPPVAVVVEEGALPAGMLEDAILLRGGSIAQAEESLAGVWTVRVAPDSRVVVEDPRGTLVVDRRIDAFESAAARARTISLIVVEAQRTTLKEPRAPMAEAAAPAFRQEAAPPFWRHLLIGAETSAANGPVARVGLAIGVRLGRGLVDADVGVGLQNVVLHGGFRPSRIRAFPGNAYQLRGSLGLRTRPSGSGWIYATGGLGELEFGEARFVHPADDVARAHERPGASVGPWISARRSRGTFAGLDVRLSGRVPLLKARIADLARPIEPSVALTIGVSPPSR